MRKGWSSKKYSYWDRNNMAQKSTLLLQTIAEEADKKRRESEEYPIALMMKLGWDQAKADNAFSTIDTYGEVIKKQGETWFGTNALASGIGKRRRQEFLSAISNHKKVHMYFLIGKSGGGSNEIEYRAQVVDLESKKGGMLSPQLSLTPEEYQHQKCSIWIKLTNLEVYKEKTVADFKFANNDKQLKQALNSTCCFSYITELYSTF